MGGRGSDGPRVDPPRDTTYSVCSADAIVIRAAERAGTSAPRTAIATPAAPAAGRPASSGASQTALMGHGLSNAEPARAFTLSEATVKTHVARILAKLSLRDRAQAVVLAYGRAW